MSKSEAYKSAIEAVINSSLDHGAIFDVLELLFDEYRSAKWCEKHNASLKQATAEAEQGEF